MSLKEILGELFTDEIKAKIEASGKAVFIHGVDEKVIVDDNNHIPLAEHMKVKGQVRSLETQLEDAENKVNSFKAMVKDSEELSGKVENLSNELKMAREQHAEELKRISFNHDLETVLKDKYGANDTRTVLPLLNMDVISLESGNFHGLDAQMVSLVKSHDFLFGQKVVGGNPPKDTNPEIDQSLLTKNPFSKDHWNLTQQAILSKTDPEKAAALSKAAATG